MDLNKTTVRLIRMILGAFLLFSASSPIAAASASLPLTGSGDSQSEFQQVTNRRTTEDKLPSLSEFTAAVADGQNRAVRGIYVVDHLALRVLQQPASNPGYVTSAPDGVSQFGMAAAHGSLGLLAHNYLAGEQFFDLRPGDIVIVVYADGSRAQYRIDAVHRYQALSPASPLSDFLELTDEGALLSARQLFDMMYGVHDQLVLQTCIERDGNLYWGRLFVVATPFDPGADFDAKLQRLQVAGFFDKL